jgi:hypothetical protein
LLNNGSGCYNSLVVIAAAPCGSFNTKRITAAAKEAAAIMLYVLEPPLLAAALTPTNKN